MNFFQNVQQLFFRQFHINRIFFESKGTLKWFNAKIGYGFIAQESGKDLYVHSSGFTSKLDLENIKPGDKVEYSMEKKKKNKSPAAINVKIISKQQNPQEKIVQIKENKVKNNNDTKLETIIDDKNKKG